MGDDIWSLDVNKYAQYFLIKATLPPFNPWMGEGNPAMYAEYFVMSLVWQRKLKKMDKSNIVSE